jgi:hypothetical protein
MKVYASFKKLAVATPALSDVCAADETGCFTARVADASLHGVAVAGEEDDGAVNFGFILGEASEGNAMTITRAGSTEHIRTGIRYPIGNGCAAEQPTNVFVAHYIHVIKQPSFEFQEYFSTAGTVMIDQIANGRISGRFELTTCRQLEDRVVAGPVITGAFNALWFGH